MKKEGLTGLEQAQKILKKTRNAGTKCVKCRIPIEEEITGIQKVENGYMCDDCYYGAWGEEIEKHPIIGPHRR